MPIYNPNVKEAHSVLETKPTHIYVLTNLESGGYYIGITSNIVRRLDQHRVGDTYGSSKLGDSKKLVIVTRWKAYNRLLALFFEAWLWEEFYLGNLENIVKDRKALNKFVKTYFANYIVMKQIEFESNKLTTNV